MRTRDVKVGKTYNCSCKIGDRLVTVKILRRDDSYDAVFQAFNCTCSDIASCLHGCTDNTCVVHPFEICKEAGTVNTLGNFPKKEQEV